VPVDVDLQQVEPIDAGRRDQAVERDRRRVDLFPGDRGVVDAPAPPQVTVRGGFLDVRHEQAMPPDAYRQFAVQACVPFQLGERARRRLDRVHDAGRADQPGDLERKRTDVRPDLDADVAGSDFPLEELACGRLPAATEVDRDVDQFAESDLMTDPPSGALVVGETLRVSAKHWVRSSLDLLGYRHRRTVTIPVREREGPVPSRAAVRTPQEGPWAFLAGFPR
jgi:hypothetical protein